jgi:hypothetical protein
VVAARAAVGLTALAVTLALAAGCGGRRIEQGVFHSPKGYRATLPGARWSVVESSRADLELRHDSPPAGMFVNATCRGSAPGRPVEALGRALLLGLRDRRVIERGEATVAGRPAAHAVVEATASAGDPPMRIETLTFVDAGCAYDLAYAAPAEVFEGLRGDFQRFVASFTRE